MASDGSDRDGDVGQANENVGRDLVNENVDHGLAAKSVGLAGASISKSVGLEGGVSILKYNRVSVGLVSKSLGLNKTVDQSAFNSLERIVLDSH